MSLSVRGSGIAPSFSCARRTDAEPASTIDGPYATLPRQPTDLRPLPTRVKRRPPPSAFVGSRAPSRCPAACARRSGLDVAAGSPAGLGHRRRAARRGRGVRRTRCTTTAGVQGQVFLYASDSGPSFPAVRDTVSDLGRILGFTPHREARPDMIPLDVPPRLDAERPADRLRRSPLAAASSRARADHRLLRISAATTSTDLDDFATMSVLPPLKPILIAAAQRIPRETVMDLRSRARDCARCAAGAVVRTPSTLGAHAYEHIGADVSTPRTAMPRRGVEPAPSDGDATRLVTRDGSRTPCRQALERAMRTAPRPSMPAAIPVPLECKGRPRLVVPPRPDDIGLDAVASLPA